MILDFIISQIFYFYIIMALMWYLLLIFYLLQNSDIDIFNEGFLRDTKCQN